jgi:Flp pilus assembly protein TadD
MMEVEDLEAHLRYAASYDKVERATAQVERDRVGEAMRRALSGGVNDASSLNGLAWVCATSDMFPPEALTAAERAVTLEPKETGILDTLAEVHYRMGNAAKAIEVETKALALAPTDNYLKEQIARFKSGKR